MLMSSPAAPARGHDFSDWFAPQSAESKVRNEGGREAYFHHTVPLNTMVDPEKSKTLENTHGTSFGVFLRYPSTKEKKFQVRQIQAKEVLA